MTGQDRVIAAVIDRRGELGWTQKRLAEEAGVSERTIQNFETGTRPQPVIRSKIERALGWEVGTFRRIEAEPPFEPRDDHEREIMRNPRLTEADKRQMIASYRKARAASAGPSGPGTDDDGPVRYRRSEAS